MYHSITFGEKNTWDDWHLFPSSRPVFNPPSVRTNYVDIPGADGDLDFTEALLDRPLYTNREGDFEFIVENEFRDWSVAYSDISNYLHGKYMKAFLEDDPDYYYIGRFSLNEWRSDPNWSIIVISYNVKPFKYEKLNGISGWSYKPFEDEKGVLNDYRKLKVKSGTTLTEKVEGRDRLIVPTIENTGTSPISLTFTNPSNQSTTVQLQNGSNRFESIVIRKGTNTFAFSGSGTLILNCRGGQL